MQMDPTSPTHQNSLFGNRPAAVVILVVLLTGLGPWGNASVWAQNQRRPIKEKPKFEGVSLNTKDGVRLAGTFYPGDAGKDTVPIILIHGWGGNRGEMHSLALYLQKLKHAVISMDLRGHGQSQPGSAAGNQASAKIQLDKMKKSQIATMYLDVEAAKQFLIKKNNEETLNIERLCVVGSEFGTILALNWAVLDWNARSLPAYKMGQDVKALVLISPLSSFRGLTTRPALSHPIIRSRLSIFVAAGQQDSRTFSDAKRLYSSFERFRTGKNDQGLVLFAADTSLQGAKLIDAKGVDLAQKIAQFINQQLLQQEDAFPWRDRSGPF